MYGGPPALQEEQRTHLKRTLQPRDGIIECLSGRLHFQMEISKGVTAAIAGAAGAKRNILDILFSLCQHQPSQGTCSHELFTAII